MLYAVFATYPVPDVCAFETETHQFSASAPAGKERTTRPSWNAKVPPAAPITWQALALRCSHRVRSHSLQIEFISTTLRRGFRKTASGKYKCGHANRSHILTKKATKRKRNLRQTNHVRAEDAGRLDRMLPYL